MLYLNGPNMVEFYFQLVWNSWFGAMPMLCMNVDDADDADDDEDDV